MENVATASIWNVPSVCTCLRSRQMIFQGIRPTTKEQRPRQVQFPRTTKALLRKNMTRALELRGSGKVYPDHVPVYLYMVPLENNISLV